MAFVYWAIYVAVFVVMFIGNLGYSWLIQKTRIYKPEYDLEARATKKLFRHGSVSDIAYSVFYLFVYGVIMGPIIEEFAFREWFVGYLYSPYGFWAAAVASSVIWAVLHIWYAQPYIFVVGIVYAWVWVEFGLVWCIVYHIAHNFLAIMLSIYQQLRTISEKRTLIVFDSES